MRALHDILFGFLVFFAIERGIRLFSNAVIEPWAKTKTTNEHTVETWKLASEFIALMGTAVLVYKYAQIRSKCA